MWHEDAVERIMMDYSWYLRGGRGVFPLAREGGCDDLVLCVGGVRVDGPW